MADFIPKQDIAPEPIIPEPTIIHMEAPDGKRYTIPDTSLPQAKQNGWKQYDPVQRAKEDTLKAQVNAKDQPGFQEGDRLDTIAGNFLDYVTAGVAPIVSKWWTGHTKEEQAIVDAREKASEEEDPWLNRGAKAAGFGLTLLLPIPKAVGAAGTAIEGGVKAAKIGALGRGAAEVLSEKGPEALAELAQSKGPEAIANASSHEIGDKVARAVDETSKIVSDAASSAVAKDSESFFNRQLAGKIAKNMAIAEAYGAPAQIANATVGDPEQAKESLLWSLGLGGLLGVGEHAFGPAIADAIKGMAGKTDTAILERSGIDLKGIEDKKQDILDLLKSEKRFSPVDEKFNNSVAEDAKNKIQPELNRFDNNLEDLNNKINIQSDTTKAALEDQAKKSPLKTNYFGVNPAEVANKFSSDVDAANPHLLDQAAKDPAHMYNKITNTFSNYGGVPTTFDNTKSLSEALDNLKVKNPHAIDEIAERDSKLIDDAKTQLNNHTQEAMQKSSIALNEGNSNINLIAQQKRLATANLMNENLQPPVAGEKASLGKALLGGAIALSGHPAIGAAVGLGGSTAAAKSILKGIALKAVMPIVLRGMNKLAETAPEMFGSGIANAANEATDSHLREVIHILSEGGEALPYRSIDPLTSILGSSANGRSKEKQYNLLTDKITEANANPKSIAGPLGELSSVFSDNPHLQSLVSQHNLAALSYLHSIMPRDPNPHQAFGSNDWEPTAAEKQAFLNQVAIVDDPMVAVHKMAAGTCTTQDRVTLQTVYPVIYQKITGEVIKLAFSPAGKDVKAHTKESASIMIGQPLIASLNPTNYQRIQSGFTQPTQDNPPSGSGSSPKHTNKSIKGTKNSLQTETQRLSNR